MKALAGLLVSVLRSNGCDCTNNGVTSRFDELVLVDPEIPGIFAVKPERPALKLVRRTICGRPYIHAVPVDASGEPVRGSMMGGNFVYTSDGRFPNAYPIPVHDRIES